MRTLGCKVNRVESEQIASELLGMGVELAEEDAADVVVINTCTVTGEADAKARKAVRHAAALPLGPVVVVTGCLASMEAPAIEALGDRVIAEPDKAAVSGRVADSLGVERAAGNGDAARPGSGDTAFRTRAPLKIQDGCDAFCAYCIIAHARGLPRSEPLANTVALARSWATAGVPEIVLTGINLGRYSDEATGADLASVVEAVAATGVPRIRLSSIEPLDLTKRLLGVLSATDAVCEHLHVPLQSGSDALLARMGRGYTLAQFEERVYAAREVLPGLAVTTDLIAGLPGETAEDAAATLAAVERIGFAKLHVFRYSARKGTPAAEMQEQVPPAVRAERAAALRAAGNRLRAQYIAGRVGSHAEVLVETVADGIATGTTRDYLSVTFVAGEGVCPGALVDVVVEDAS